MIQAIEQPCPYAAPFADFRVHQGKGIPHYRAKVGILLRACVQRLPIPGATRASAMEYLIAHMIATLRANDLLPAEYDLP